MIKQGHQITTLEHLQRILKTLMKKTNGTSSKRKNLITILWDKPKRS